MNDNGTQAAGPFSDYSNNTSYTYDLCLEPGCYIVWMEDSYGDGWQGSTITFTDENGNMLASGAVSESSALMDLYTTDDCTKSLCSEGESLYTASITPDLYGEELVWGILDDTDASILGPFSGYQSNTYIEEHICLTDGCYTVWMEDTYGDGWQGAIPLFLTRTTNY